MDEAGYDPKEIIQLMPEAVIQWLPRGTTESDMYAALDRCGMTVEEIFEEAERSAGPSWYENEFSGAQVIENILYDRFFHRLEEVQALHFNI